MSEEQNKKIEEYRLVRVPTGEALAIETPTGETMTQEQVLVEVLNKLDRIEKAVA